MNTPSDQPNRYAAPQANVSDVVDDSVGEVAGRGERLGASILDFLIYSTAIIVPMLIGFGFSGFKMLMDIASNDGSVDAASMDWGPLLIGMGFGVAGFFVVLGITIYFEIKNRQTIGKKLVGIKVVRSDGSQVSIARLFWLRNFVSGLPGGLPFVGALYNLADPLFIFGEQRRCIHDYIADTIVVKA